MNNPEDVKNEVFVSRFPPALGGGLKVALKDNIDVAGFVTGLGCAAYAGTKPAKENAAVVDALLAANFNLQGKVTMHELAFGMTGINSFSGTPLNSIYPDFIPGGSSSGSAAAVAAELADVALATDTGGSIRLPSACCGVVGLKPTYGRVSRAGILPAESELDCVGPIAQSVENIECCMRAVDETFVVQPEPTESIFGVLSVRADKVIQEAFQSAIECLGLARGITTVPVHLAGMDEAFDAGMTLIANEMNNAFGHLPPNLLGSDVSQRLANAAGLGSGQIAAANAIKQQFSRQVSALLEQVDVLLLPTLPALPLLRDEALNGATDIESSRLVRPFNVSGHPAITIPLRLKAKLPLGLQLVGSIGQDETLCAIAKKVSGLINSDELITTPAHKNSRKVIAENE